VLSCRSGACNPDGALALISMLAANRDAERFASLPSLPVRLA
jgi:hypothetical protein